MWDARQSQSQPRHQPNNQLAEAVSREGRAALAGEHVRRLRLLFSLYPPQQP
jgi:hypothetical protein